MFLFKSKQMMLVLLASLAIGCTTSNQIDTQSEIPTYDLVADRIKLLKLNEELARSQIIDRDPVFFTNIAVDEFRVLAPGGMIENKEKVIAGLGGWNVVDIKLTNTEVVFYKSVATVLGRMDIDGEMKPVGRWGPLKYMSTWVRDGDDWKLVSRSLTPCLEMLIKMGRC